MSAPRSRMGSALVALLAALTAVVSPAVAQTETDEFAVVGVATIGLDLETRTPVALLRDHTWGQLVPIWIGEEESAAIRRAIQGEQPERPLTHDLLTNVINEMGGRVEEVAIHGKQGTTYVARIHVRMGAGPAAETRDIDSRPSDALAVALRTGAVIKVARSIILEAPDVDFVALEGKGQVVRAFGMTVAPITPERRQEFAIPEREGVVVVNVSEEMGQLGLQPGDLLVDVNAEVPTTPIDFLRALGHSSASDPILIVYLRNGAETLLRIARPQRERDGNPHFVPRA